MKVDRVRGARLMAGWSGWKLCLGIAVAIGVTVVPGFAQDLSATATQATQTASPPDGSADRAGIPERFATPSATTFTFLQAMTEARHNSDAWDTVRQCMDLSRVNPQRTEELGSKLIGVFNRIGKVDPREFVIDDSSASFTYFPRFFVHDWVKARADPDGSIVLVKQASGRWVFSAETVAGIDDLYDSLKRLPILHGDDERTYSRSLWLESLMPESLQAQRFLTIKYWQWLGLLVLVFLGVTVDHTVRFGLRLVTNRVFARHRVATSKQSVSATVRPLGLLAGGVLWLVMLRVLGLPDAPLTVLLAAVRIFTILAGTLAMWHLVDLICEVLSAKAEKTSTKFDDVLIPLLRKSVKIFVVAFALVYGAAALSIPIVPMLTSLGIGGLAFAFAAKDTIENFFGSVAVILDRPFEVGDWVVIGDVEGTVEEVGFRSTRVRTFYNSQVTVPNATLVRATVDNYGRRRYRRVKTHIGIQYDTPPEKVIAFTEGIRELVRTHPYTRKDYFQVWFHQFGPSSLDILLYVFHETPDWSTELRERERLFLDMMRLAKQLGVEFAFPTRTVHLHTDSPFPGEPVRTGDNTGPSDRPGDPMRSGSMGSGVDSGVDSGVSGVSDERAMKHGISIARALVKGQPWRTTTPGPVKFGGEPVQLDLQDEENQIDNRTAGG